MEVHQICQLGPGTPIWVWIVRVGKGRWWPGAVLSITAREPFPRIDTRFECRSTGRNGADGPAFVGISTTRMRYLELRDLDLKGDDRPNFVPSAIFHKPEPAEGGLNDVQHRDTITLLPITQLPTLRHLPRNLDRGKRRKPQIQLRMQLSSRLKRDGT
jgi:hypothetical protein